MRISERSFAWRGSFIALSLLGSGCDIFGDSLGANSEASHGGPHDSTGAECTKDPEVIRGVMLSPPECDTATPCPCGTVCSDELGGHCTADCVDDTWCAPGHLCSGFGLCVGEDELEDADVNPTCPRNEELLDTLESTPRACSFDDECPFGAFCDRGEGRCRSECRIDTDCPEHDDGAVCSCLGKCAEPDDLRGKPHADLPKLEIDTKAFYLSHPDDTWDPNWGDANQREVVLKLRSAVAEGDGNGDDLAGPSATIWVTPDEHTLVSCESGVAAAAEPCSVTIGPDGYATIPGKDGYESEPAQVTFAPDPDDHNATLWEITLASSGVHGGRQTVRAWYGAAAPDSGASDIGPGYLGAGFRASGVATLQTPTGATLSVPVEARVFFDDTLGMVLALHDSSLSLSPTGTLALGTSWDLAWLDSAVDEPLQQSFSGKVAGWPILTSLRQLADNKVSGTADLGIVIPSSDTVSGDGAVSDAAYRFDTKLAFTLVPDPDGAPSACASDADCSGREACSVGFCGGTVKALTPWQPFQITQGVRDVWTVNRDSGLSQEKIEVFAFLDPTRAVARASFVEPSRVDRELGTAGDFQAWFYEAVAAGTYFPAPMVAVPLLRATEDATWQTSSGLLMSCLAELARTPTQPRIPGGSQSDWLTDPEYIVTYPTCINLGRFFFGLRDRALYQRLLQQWLEVHSFVAREGLEEFQLSKVAKLIDDSPAANAKSAEQLMQTVESGLSLVLSELSTTGTDGQTNALLAKLTAEELSNPDYRQNVEAAPGFSSPEFCADFRPCLPEFECKTYPSGATGCVPRTIDETPQFDQPVGVPPLLLEAAANYLKLVGAVLEDAARSVYGTDGGKTARQLALARYGRALRFAITIELVAKTYYERTLPCSGGNCAALGRRFEAAAAEYQAALQRASRGADALRGNYDLYGVPANEVALFFGDPVGTSSRYFASSDYLLNGYAEPAVQSAQGALTDARQAWISQRDSLVQDQLNKNNHLNEVDAIKSKYGSVILENCGAIDVPGTSKKLESADVLEFFSQTPLDNSTCFISPSCAEVTELDLVEQGMRNAFMRGAAFRYPNGEYLEATLPEVLRDSVASKSALQQACAIASMRDRYFVTNLDSFAKKVAYICSNNNSDGTQPDAFHECFVQREDDDHFYLLRMASNDVRIPLAAFYRPIRRSELGVNGTFRYVDPDNGSTIDGQPLNWVLDGPDDNVYDYFDYSASDYVFDGRNTIASAYSNGIAACRDGRNGHSDKAYPMPAPGGLDPECYRGTMGTAYHEMQAAKAGLERAQGVIDNGKEQIVDQYDLCTTIDAHRQTLSAMRNEVEGMRDDYEFVSGLVSGASALGKAASGDIIGGFQGIIGLGLDLWGDAIADEERRVQRLADEFSSEEKSMECWNTWRDQRRQLRTAMLDVKIGFETLAKEIAAFNNLASANNLALQEGLSALERDAKRPIGTLAHHYWLDEKVERFKKQLEWARRLSLLAVNAVEYEFQQSLPYRTQIAEAIHPNQLEDVVVALKAEQASRTINRRRPEESAIVVSLRDDVMGIMDRTDAGPGERDWQPAQRFASRLWDERYSLRSEAGSWLGQGIPFTLGPTDVLETRCGERMWRVTATVQGDGLGTDAPNASVILLKRNTFFSQFCEGKGHGMQTGAIRPSAELFKPGSQIDLADADQMTGALLTPWFNVSRSDFYKESYQEGASEELAGRGLYGDYVLLFPKQLLDDGFALERVEDVLLRIDYLSVNNLEN